jgi:hypothetical protein
MQKSDTAWKTAARMAALAEETDDDYEREHFTRLRDAWITLANRCEPFDFPDVQAAGCAGAGSATHVPKTETATAENLIRPGVAWSGRITA